MGDVIGRTSSLPGAMHKVPSGTMCDEHPDRPAVARIQGETDSFGAELIDGCAECKGKWDAYKNQPKPGTCDWCKCEADNLKPRRDWEEGMAGPVYEVCSECIKRDNENIARELQEMDRYTDTSYQEY